MIGRKIFVLVVTLLISLSTFGILNDNKKVEASGGGGRDTSIIDYDWVYDNTYELSEIVKTFDYGRDFGTPGELDAKDLIKGWMQEIMLSSISSDDPISERWTNSDWWAFSDNYCGDLFKKRVPVKQDCWIHVTVEDTYNNNNIVYDKTFSVNSDPRTCFPFLKSPYFDNSNGEFDFGYNLKVVNASTNNLDQDSCLLVANDWKSPGAWGYQIHSKTQHPHARAFIVYNEVPMNTYFMYPSFKDHILLGLGGWPKPGFSITGSEGVTIQNYVNNDDRYNVIADMRSHWNYANVPSYNVIGSISGSSSDKVNVVCAHYDCWWNQGTIDEALETALVLGIAKYMKTNDIQPRYNTKFIAFAGEEHGFRGSKDYVKKHNSTEEYNWVINPGNFGHIDGGIFKFSSDNSIGSHTATNVARALDYYNTSPDYSVTDEAEDGVIFKQNRYNNPPEGILIFSRWPYKGYHCDDGDTHDQGDVMSLLDDYYAPLECDVILLTTLHLIVDLKLQFQDCSITRFDSGNDNKNDSVRVYFNINCDHDNVPTAGNVKVSIVDKNTYETVCWTETGFQIIDKGETKYGSFSLILQNDHPGLYDVQVRLINATGDDDNYDDYYNETVYLNLYDYPIADFSYSPINPTDIEDIQFTDHSYPSDGPDPHITSWHWDFGDGNTSNQQNPVHQYGDDGFYNVNLTIWDNHNKI